MWRRRRRWPKIDFYQAGGRGDMKAVSAPGMDRLMRKADAAGWSACGRPEWFLENKARFRRLETLG